MALRLVRSDVHLRASVDPFGVLPCRHDEVLVHISSSDSMGDDLVECPHCQVVASLEELYRGLFPGK